MEIPLQPRKRSHLPFFLVTLVVLIIAGGFAIRFVGPKVAGDRMIRISKIRTWFENPVAHSEWQVNIGESCGDAPMIMPTTGYIGVGWGDGFRPTYAHTGYDIFSPDGAENITPIVAAFDGYLTRESGWRSAVIIRHPDFPDFPGAPRGVPGAQIWTYYTHMASADGGISYISPEFPPGTREVFVEAGTLLGYQGTWSGNPASPTGLHLHFSVVKSSLGEGYSNETEIGNTYDPAPFLGVTSNEDGILICRAD
jgi:murein DD-endopeptidase MepM/ murein hydrolase activator NlpD